jgi:hypothetical protein
VLSSLIYDRAFGLLLFIIMNKLIQSALISVFYKDGLDKLALQLHRLGVTIYSTGGTQQLLEKLNTPSKIMKIKWDCCVCNTQC